MSSTWRTKAPRHPSRGGPPKSPPTVPGYLVGELIGQGADSEVWAARCVSTGQPAALKRLHGCASRENRERLRTEAAVLASFTHAHVVALRGVRSDERGLVLVLDRAERSLAQLLKDRGPLRPGCVVAVIAPIAQALHAAHERGILHGDISPRNILLRSDGTPLLADLGTARLTQLCGTASEAVSTSEAASISEPGTASETVYDSQPLTGTGIFGTPGFVDPVLELGAPFTAASDVYSLAAVAACALVGEPLAIGPDSLQHWANLVHQLGVPPALTAAICTTLVAQPAARPAMADFCVQLRQTCAVTPLTPLDMTEMTNRAAHQPSAYGNRKHDFELDVFGATRQVGLAVNSIATPSTKPSQWARCRAAMARWRTHHARIRPRLHRLGRPRRKRLPHIAAVAFLVVVALGVGALWVTVNGTDSTPHNQRQQVVPPTLAQAEADRWRTVLDRLDERRADAFSRLDPQPLTQVYAPSSAMLRADQQQITRLRETVTLATGLRHVFRAIHVIAASDTKVTLQLAEQLHSHHIVQLDLGSSQRSTLTHSDVSQVPTSPERTTRMELVLVDGQWRIHDVTPT